MTNHHTSHRSRLRRVPWCLLAALSGCATAYADVPWQDAPDADERPPAAPEQGAPTAEAPSLRTAPGPSGREIAKLSRERCLALLEARGVPFEQSPEVPGGVRLEGPVRGVEVRFVGDEAVHAVLDCRLALALAAWAPALEEAGVRTLRHVSALRPAARVRGTRRRSGHADGRAVDIRWFVLEDGTELDVLEAWVARRRGAAPCSAYDEPASSALLRRLVCDAVDRELFQVVVTPHHDRAHANHVHLEVRGDVDWTWIR